MRFQKGGNVGAANVRWSGDKPSKSAGRQRARALFPGVHVCEVDGCGKKAERHHKDDDTGNNSPSNIAFLCHKHHVQADGRMRRPGLRAACDRTGTKLTAEQRAKISAAHTGMKRSDAAKAAMSAAMKASYANRQKPTHCPQGHLYDDSNRSNLSNGRLSCKACARARALRNYRAKSDAITTGGAM